MNLSLEDFVEGFTKKADDAVATYPFASNGSIFPTSATQTKWKYAKGNGKLQLHDGNIIHNFSYEADDIGEEDFPMTKLEDVSYFDFGKELAHTGTAQVHRSDPNHVYVTLHDGKANPTLAIKHVEGGNWRASPKTKKKHAEEIDLEAFQKGLTDKLAFLDSILKGVHSGAGMLGDGIRSLGNNPMASAGVGLGLGATYDLGRRAFYNTEEENEQESGFQRLMRYALPTAALGGTGAAMKMMAPNTYKYAPVYDSMNPNNKPNTPYPQNDPDLGR